MVLVEVRLYGSNWQALDLGQRGSWREVRGGGALLVDRVEDMMTSSLIRSVVFFTDQEDFSKKWLYAQIINVGINFCFAKHQCVLVQSQEETPTLDPGRGLWCQYDPL